MTRKLGVAHLTAIDLPPVAFIEASARAGFDHVGLRLLRVTETSPGYPLMDDPAAMRATRRALAATGLTVHDIEFLKITPETDPARFLPFLDAGAELGAKQVICAPYDPDLHRLAERLAELSFHAAGRGLGIVLEFFPWTVVPDLATARRVTEAADEKVGILVDSLHFDRSDSSLEQLRSIPSARLPFAHLADAMVQPSYCEAKLLHTARDERLPPGEGQIGLRDILAALPMDLPISVEVPMSTLAAAEGYDAVLRRVARASRQLLGRSEADDEGPGPRY